MAQVRASVSSTAGHFRPHADGDESLPYRSWSPQSGSGGACRAVVIWVHGAFSFSGDAKNPGEALASRGIALYAFDLRGWGGEWRGTRGHLSDRQEYIDDVMAFHALLRERYGSQVPFFLVGHSMGGLIAAATLLQHQDSFRGAALLCPWLKTVAAINPIVRAMAPLVAMVYPEMSQENAIKAEDLTSDAAEQARFNKDKEAGLRSRSATVGWFLQIEKLQAEVQEQAARITIPCLVAVAGGDVVVDSPAIKSLYEKIGGAAKELLDLPTMKHEIHNEVDRAKVFDRIAEFVFKHVPQPSL